MSRPTYKRKSARKTTGLQMMRSKGALGAVAGTIVLGFVGAVIAFGPPPEDQEDIDPSPTPSSSAALSPETLEELQGKSTCGQAPKDGATALVPLDSAEDLEVVSGQPQISAVNRTPQSAAIELNIGQDTNETLVHADFAESKDLSKGRIGIWIKQNGNLASPPGLWRVRLLTGSEGGYFERAFRSATVRDAAREWCFDVSGIGKWTSFGEASADDVRGIEYSVPGYPGAGAGNVVALDDPVLF